MLRRDKQVVSKIVLSSLFLFHFYAFLTSLELKTHSEKAHRQMNMPEIYISKPTSILGFLFRNPETGQQPSLTNGEMGKSNTRTFGQSYTWQATLTEHT